VNCAANQLLFQQVASRSSADRRVQYGSAEARVTILPRIDTWRVDVVTTMTARQILHAENTRLRKLCVAVEMISRKAAAGMVRKACSAFSSERALKRGARRRF
jgi:hypothetical protein